MAVSNEFQKKTMFLLISRVYPFWFFISDTYIYMFYIYECLIDFPGPISGLGAIVAKSANRWPFLRYICS